MTSPAQPPPPRPDVDDDPFGTDLVREYLGFVLRAPLRHRRVAVACAVVVLALAFAVLAVIPIRWRIEATMLAQNSPIMSRLSNPEMNREWDRPARGAREAIIRRENLIALCKQLDFPTRYLATRAPAVRARDWLQEKLGVKERDRDELLEDLVDTLETRLTVNTTESGNITISFLWSDPALSVEIVQAAMQGFLEERYASEITSIGEAISILESHDARVQREISTTIAQVEEKERTLRIRTTPRVALPRRPEPQDDQTAALERTLAAKRRALTEVEDFRQRRISELQALLSQQQATLAAQHPAVVSTQHALESFASPSPQLRALQAEVAELERNLSARDRRLPELRPSTAMDAELAAARMRLQSEDPRLEFERRQLQNLLRQHASIVARIDAARVERDTAQAAFKYRYTVITPPQIPKKPARPYGLLVLAGGFVAAVLAAIAVPALLDLRAGRVLERWQIERALHVPVVGDLRS